MTTPKRSGSKRSLSPSAANGGGRAKVSRTDNSACGIIQKVSLANFMCHGSFEWSPNRNVNFVTGANGSGKSSILQGLVLGLLADSKHTKRYSKLQDFVRRGANKAEIQITLKNEGEDAYKLDIYGNSITFHRTIWESGVSSVYIKDQRQNVVKKNKEAREEGKRILECFRINTENPIAILQQEEAKELLKVESPGALYTFFQKSTLLKQCIDQYSQAKTQLDLTKESVQKKKSGLKDIKSKFDEKKKIYDKMVKMDEWKEEEKRLSQEYVLALGLDKKNEITEREAEVEKKSAVENKAKEKLKQLNAVNGENDKKKMELEVRLENEREAYAHKEVELNSIKLKTDKLREREKSIAKDIKGLENTKKTIEGEIRITEEQISTVNSASNAKMRKQREKERIQKLSQVDAEMTHINEEIERLGYERESVDTNLEQTRKETQTSEYEKKAVNIKVSKLEKEYQDMQNFGSQQLAMFDTMAPRVAEQIRQAAKNQQFKISPIGPVGSFIKLTSEAVSNPNLARLIETELNSNILRCYLCNDDDDRRVLWNIFNQVYGNRKKPNIFTSKFLSEEHRVQRVEKHKTVMDYVEIVGTRQEKVVVFNHLVDQRSIESVVVTKSQDEAKKLCTFIQHVPRNLNYCITQDFNKFFPPTKSASYRSYYIDPVQSTVLGSNMSIKMDEKRREIEKTKEVVQDVGRNHVILEKKKASFDRELENIKNKIAELRQNLAKCNANKSQLKAEEDATENLDSLQERLELKEKELNSIKTQQESKIDEKKVVLTNIKEKTAEYNKILKEVTKLRDATAPLESEKSRLEGMFSSKRKEIANQEKVTKKVQQEIQSLKMKLVELRKEEKTIKQKVKQLKTPDDLIPSGTSKQLKSKIENIKAKQLKEAGIENSDAIQQELVDLNELYQSQKKRIEDTEEYCKKLEQMNIDRNTNYLYIRNTITNMVQRRFGMLSATFRKQFGNEIYIRLDHKRKELIWVFKNADGDNMNTEINSLSGGEKSYAQMCLIAALWENMNPPFRALDEWDVYLDAINRKEISNTLMSFGLKHLDYQFLFISPQGAGDIKYDAADSRKVSILEVEKSK